MENKNNETTNTTMNLINSSEKNLITDLKSEQEEFEEDETDTPIVGREIKSYLTTPYK